MCYFIWKVTKETVFDAKCKRLSINSAFQSYIVLTVNGGLISRMLYTQRSTIFMYPIYERKMIYWSFVSSLPYTFAKDYFHSFPQIWINEICYVKIYKLRTMKHLQLFVILFLILAVRPNPITNYKRNLRLLVKALIELLKWLYENVLDVFILSLNVREKNTQKRENNNIAHMSLWCYRKNMDLKYLYLKMLMQDLV